jgi:hypothetical protein
MSVLPCTWPEWYRAGQSVGYQYMRAVEQQIEAIKPACRDLTPYIYRDNAVGALLLCKGKLLERSANGDPAVHFAITLKPQFPNAYPILSIEQPPEGWQIKNHPHVDREGICYLNTVSTWNPRSSSVFGVCAELQTVLSTNYPYERNANAAPRQAQLRDHQNRLSAPAPQQRSTGAPQVAQPQSAGAARPPPGQQQPPQPLGLMIAGALLSALATGATGTSSSGRTENARAADGRTVPVLSAEEEHRAQQQRERDRQWLAQQQQQQQQGQGAHRHQLVREEQRAASDFVKERFAAILSGTTPVAPGTEIAVPPDFGLARIKTHPHGVRGPLMLARRAAPRPLQPVLEPTPDEHFHNQQADRERQRREDEQAQARAPPPQNTFGVGLRALSRTVSAMGHLAATAKHSVEDKVRTSKSEEEAQRFAQLFPAVVQRGERLVTNYHCRMICGDGIARPGYLFITLTHAYFSSKPSADASEWGGAVPTSASTGPIVQSAVPFTSVVSIALGQASSDSKCLHLVCRDNSVRSFLGFHTNRLIEVGSYVTASVKGTAFDRCYNWLDHKWRENVMAIPVAGYPYDADLPPNIEPAPAAPASGIGSGPVAVPPPATMYEAQAPPQSQVAPPPMPTGPAAAPHAAPGSPLGSESADQAEQMLCAVCMENPKNCFLRPCGHVAACMLCAAQLRACPVCRTPIEDRFQAFL